MLRYLLSGGSCAFRWYPSRLLMFETSQLSETYNVNSLFVLLKLTPLFLLLLCDFLIFVIFVILPTQSFSLWTGVYWWSQKKATTGHWTLSKQIERLSVLKCWQRLKKKKKGQSNQNRDCTYKLGTSSPTTISLLTVAGSRTQDTVKLCHTNSNSSDQ